MTDPMTPRHGERDPLLLLVERLSQTQVEQGRLLSRQTDDQHAIRLMLERIQARLDPLSPLVEAVSSIRLAQERQSHQLDTHSTQLARLREDVDGLAEASAHRSGWEGPLGKLLYLVASAVVAALVAVAMSHMSPARAAERPDLRRDAAGNAQCWAAPARRRPQWLLL